MYPRIRTTEDKLPKAEILCLRFNNNNNNNNNNMGHAVAQLVEALRYKTEGRGFDFPWCHWNFS